jgi:hypothetical protein
MQNPNRPKPLVSGAIFERENPSGRGPTFTGNVEIAGVKYDIAVWAKTSAAGAPYYSISENKPRPPMSQQAPRPAGYPAPQSGGGYASQRYGDQHGNPARPQSPPSRNNDMDDDIPF